MIPSIDIESVGGRRTYLRFCALGELFVNERVCEIGRQFYGLAPCLRSAKRNSSVSFFAVSGLP